MGIPEKNGAAATDPGRPCRRAPGSPWVASALCALLLALPFEASGQEGPRWYGSEGAEETSLAYGVPGGDETVVSFRCEADRPDLRIVLHRDPGAMEEGGERLAVHLRAGTVLVDLVGRGVIEQNYGSLEITIDASLDDPMRHLLTSGKPLAVTIEGRTQTLPMADATAWGRRLVAACGSPKAAGNLAVTVVNGTARALASVAIAEAGSDARDSGPFGTGELAPGATRSFTIRGGRDLCRFDFWLQFAEADDEECCSDPVFAGTQDLCASPEFIVRDRPGEASAAVPAEADPWVGQWQGEGLSATIRRGTEKPEFLVIELVAGQSEPPCGGAITLYGKPEGGRVTGQGFDPGDRDASACRVRFSLDASGYLQAQTAGACSAYHGAACEFDGSMLRERGE